MPQRSHEHKQGKEKAWSMKEEAMIKQDPRFAFGANWQAFLSVLTEERILAAEQSLLSLLSTTSLEGKIFLDIGCGSGLFSLAARRLGARVHSFDYDPQSVGCTLYLRQRYFPEDAHWTVERGSALDTNYLQGLPVADIVYSWGVLHHTGDLWNALSNVPSLVAPGGTLALAIYNQQGFATKIWTIVKRAYVHSPVWGRLLIAGLTCLYFEFWHMVDRILHMQPPLPFADWKNYKTGRGMSRWHDYVDWAGGYPFETATPDQVFQALHPRGFELIRLRTVGGGLGCNEFTFRRKLPSEPGYTPCAG